MDPFWQALPTHSDLPDALRALHGHPGKFSGRCSVEAGSSWVVRSALWLGRFPPVASDIAIRIVTRQDNETWFWTRDFAGHLMQSSIRFDPKTMLVCEKAGVLTFWLKPIWNGAELKLKIQGLSVFGVPCPGVLVPKSSTVEWQDAVGRFRFDVSARLPVLGLLIRYHGWLTPDHASPD
ncbi:DUF4166 domain-containing protein [Ruegeria lacuscaerulensis]|uniref:DUF4166 domain-containing protein n=1 Tax=Ruegeria lacuscaerulensis TaxID=55218 RepID=UPI00147D99CA|nr:DUF4166 domain-containing protein [Ruegeria lacuscaerulensis]